MKLRFIFNPVSGRHRRNARLQPLVRSLIERRRLDADLVETQGPGHATVLAAEAVASGCTRVVAVGGDGTMNEVAQALLGAPVALALVPCGSGNGLALHLGLPLTAESALDLASDPAGLVASIDTGLVNNRPFFNAMGLGLDAEISRRFNRLTTRGLPAYATTALAAFLGRRTQRCTITCAGIREEIDILILSVANSDQYGNRALIAPGARVDDGALDLVAIRNVGALGAAVLAARLFTGKINGSSRVRHLRGTRFVIERPGPGLIHTDGETHEEGSTIDVQVRPASLRVILPAETQTHRAPVKFPAEFALQLP